MMIIKRDGRKVDFVKEKIEKAVYKSFVAIDGDLSDESISLASKIANSIEAEVNRNHNKEYSVEDIQEIVENKLMASSRKDVARAYITYRNERTKARERNSKFRDRIRDKLFAKNVQNQNANVDEKSFGGRKGEADSVLLKEMALDELVSDMARNNHVNNMIYIHDLDAYLLGSHNCDTLPFKNALKNGVNTRQTDIRPAGSVNTAMQLVAVFFQIQSLCQFGGVGAGSLDHALVPYVRKSFWKHYRDGMVYCEELTDVKGFEKASDTERSIEDPSAKEFKAAYRYAMDMTVKETKQAAEGLMHNLNSLQSRSGNQLPFSSINYGTCTLPEGRMVIRALLEASIDGVGKFHRTSIFPCGIFQYKKGINDKKGTPNYELKRLALKSTSRRLYPNYANGDWSTQIAQLKKDRDLKKSVIDSLSTDKYSKLLEVIKRNQEVGEQLYLKVNGSSLSVDMEEKPEESFSTMGALDGKEHLYVRINNSDPIDISIKDLFNICISDEDGESHNVRIYYNNWYVHNIVSPLWNKEDKSVSDTCKSGVYRITYIPQDVSYIGSSADVLKRIEEHKNYISLYGGLDTGLVFGDSDLNNYRFEVLEYSDKYKTAEYRYIRRSDEVQYRCVSDKHYKDMRNWNTQESRPNIFMDKYIPQDFVNLDSKDIKVLDRDNKWVKVCHIFRNDEMNTPYMMHIIYVDGNSVHTLCCTEDHPLWTGNGFTKAADLTPSHKLYRADGKELKIMAVKWRTSRAESFDIGTETGSFVGSDIIMHNCRTVLGDDINFDADYYNMLIDRVIEGKSIEHYILSKAQKDGRGNICPVTIILPTLAMMVDGEIGSKDIKMFMELLENKLNEAKDMLVERFEWICSQSEDSAKFMYENHMMAGYVPEEGIRSALRHGTLAVGQLGLAECLQILIGCDHTEPEGLELAKKIETFINKKVLWFKENYKLNFGVYYTPAESLCYKAVKKFKEVYGVIPNVSDRDYFTNSMHVPVWKNMSPFDKIDIESQLTGFSNAGCITYVELDGSTINNIDALEQIVDYAMKKDIPYAAVNVPSDSCLSCGFQGEFNSCCPQCGSENIQQLRRVTGYLTGNYRTAFNKGKQDEVKDRVHHVNRMTSLDGGDV